MKLIFILVLSLLLGACYYPTIRQEIDPVTGSPTGNTTTAVHTNSDPVMGLALTGTALATAKQNTAKKNKKNEPFPKPPEEVLKPMADEKAP